MNLDWKAIDRWLVGEAWVNSRLPQHLTALCETIGTRWASSPGEAQAVAYINEEMQSAGLDPVVAEEYTLHTWMLQKYHAVVPEDQGAVAILPFNRCPTCDVRGPLVDVGYGTSHALEDKAAMLPGAVAIVNLGLEPFSQPVPLAYRLQALAAAGAKAAVVVDRKDGGRVEYHSTGDWRDPGPDEHPLPTVAVTREEGARLRRAAAQGKSLHLWVDADFYDAPAHNTRADLVGSLWPEQQIILGGHHDTVFGTVGGNDNASGTGVVMEVARVLAGLQQEMGIRPGCTLRFVTYSAEEQTLQGAAAFVAQHFGPELPPRLAINLDELSTATMKGLVLAFPQLRKLVQRQFDEMGDGLQVHVMGQLDPSSDHFPYIAAGLEAAHLWRWRFGNRHPDSDFHHEPGDTIDKVRVRELKEYVAHLARLLLRLSYVTPEEWPANPITREQVAARLEAERGQLIRIS